MTANSFTRFADNIYGMYSPILKYNNFSSLGIFNIQPGFLQKIPTTYGFRRISSPGTNECERNLVLIHPQRSCTSGISTSEGSQQTLDVWFSLRELSVCTSELSPTETADPYSRIVGVKPFSLHFNAPSVNNPLTHC